MTDQHDVEIERRISTESRLTRVEQGLAEVRESVKDSKVLVTRISNSLDNLVIEIASAKSAFATFYKTIGIIGGLIVLLVSTVYTVGYLRLPSVAEAHAQK